MPTEPRHVCVLRKNMPMYLYNLKLDNPPVPNQLFYLLTPHTCRGLLQPIGYLTLTSAQVTLHLKRNPLELT